MIEDPEVVEPEIVEPEIVEPEIVEPEIVEPDVVDVTVAVPVATKAGVRDTIRDTSPGLRPIAPPPAPIEEEPTEPTATERETPAAEPTVLPAVRRSGRTIHRLRTRPWRTAGIAVAMVLIAGAIPALGVFAGKTIIDSREGRLVARAGRAADVVLPPTPAQVIVGLDAEGQAETIALASLRPGGRGGFFILMPTLLRVEVPGIGPAPLASAFATGGTTLLRQTVETALDIRVEQVSVLDTTSWPTVVTGPIDVSFDDPVAIPGVDGRLEELFPAGPSSLTADDVPVVLGARTPAQTEAARLVRYEEMWRGILASIGNTTPPPPTSPPTTSSSADPVAVRPPLPVEQHLAALAGGDYEVLVLPVLALDGEPESYRPDEGAMHLLVAEAMPGAVSPPTNSARIRLVNTIGDPDAMLTAANLVLLLGANLVIASDSGDTEASTQVLYSTPGFKGAAEFLAELLGVGSAAQDATVIDGIDLTVVLGSDFAAEVARHQATSTTSTTVRTTTTEESGSPG